jgi:hypothetical protein
MSSLAIVRQLVRKLMQADADDQRHHKRNPQIMKGKFLKTRNYPDDDDDDPERTKYRF